MAKYFVFALCFLLPAFLVADEVMVEVGNIEAVLDIIQGNAETTLEIIYNATDTEVEILQGDTIKIIQGTQAVIVEVVEGDKDALSEAIEEKPHIHYFVKTNEEGLAIFEIWGKPDIEKLEREGYQKTTKEDIHNQGYLTPSESEVEAEQSGVIDKGDDKAYGYSSWIRLVSGQIEAGSKTSRLFYAPGPLWLCCTLKFVRLNPLGPPTISGTFGPYLTWGYYTSHTFRRTNPICPSLWEQIGYHHWGNPNDRRRSRAGLHIP